MGGVISADCDRDPSYRVGEGRGGGEIQAKVRVVAAHGNEAGMAHTGITQAWGRSQSNASEQTSKQNQNNEQIGEDRTGGV
jgi:hypothetical protein